MDTPEHPPSRLTPLVSQDELHHLVDGRLTPAEAAEAEARLAGDPAALAMRAGWQAQRLNLRHLHTAVLTEPLPPTMADAARRAALSQSEAEGWWRWGGMAAGVLLAFGLGWAARGLAPRTPVANSMATAPAVFARQAVVAHAVYAPEVRHPVEVAAAQQEHLVQWLSKRLGRPLKLPQLSDEGFELVGGRLLPGDPLGDTPGDTTGDTTGNKPGVPHGGMSTGTGTGASPVSSARAQFMYQNTAGERITLYLGAVGPASGAVATPMARETAFSVVSDGPVPGFYWVDQGFGYALAGPLPRASLLRVAQAVYRQLEPATTLQAPKN